MAMLNNQMVYQLVSEFWVSLKMGTPERQKVSSFGAISQLVRFSSHPWIRWRPFFFELHMGFRNSSLCFPGFSWFSWMFSWSFSFSASISGILHVPRCLVFCAVGRTDAGVPGSKRHHGGRVRLDAACHRWVGSDLLLLIRISTGKLVM